MMKATVSSATAAFAVTSFLMTSSTLSLMVIDLTYPLKEGENIAWPVYPEYNFTILTRGYSPIVDGSWLESNYIELAEHTGTHMDAPSHFNRDHWRIHQIPVSRLVGPGVVVDVTEKVNANVDYGVTVDDLMAWESEHGKIPDGAVVLMRSGWGSRYPNKKRVFHTEDPKNTSTYHFPGFSGEAAKWLAEKRVVTAVGGDTPSPDLGIDHTFPVHRTLLSKDIIILENVANVDRMPVKGTVVFIGGINIHEGSGAPMRLLAVTDLESMFHSINGCSGVDRVSLLMLVVLLLLRFTF